MNHLEDEYDTNATSVTSKLASKKAKVNIELCKDVVNKELRNKDVITAWQEDERPRERLFRHGPENLSTAELLALCLVLVAPVKMQYVCRAGC